MREQHPSNNILGTENLDHLQLLPPPKREGENIMRLLLELDKKYSRSPLILK